MQKYMINFGGTLALCPDPVPCRFSEPPAAYPLTMTLPGTTACQQIGSYHAERNDGFLSEKYPFAGQIWLKKTVSLTPEQTKMHCELYLERTRMTRLWVNGQYIGSENSLCAPHVYDLSAHTAEQMEIVLCVKNTGYPVPGGHMTSPDTQTNWIGVTGKVQLRFHEQVYLSGLRTFPDAANGRVTVKGLLHGAASVTAQVTVQETPTPKQKPLRQNVTLKADADGAFSAEIPLMPDAPRWSEYHTGQIALTFHLENGENAAVEFGLRDFKACGDHFEINGTPTMLRGKHDGMVFPLTGAAPTDYDGWYNALRTYREWGINHLRFHTCCPPEAAFYAADDLGIYMEPELPFWGTVDAPGGEKYDKAQQEYLIREGLRICRAFGNHPSFVMFSLGNELWGSPERLGEIIRILRAADPRPLYTQGSNNFQHMPVQIPEEDFWTGVRTGKGRLIRGSFATCDAPIGRMQTHAPSAAWDYEAYLTPLETDASAENTGEETEIDIQYGTGVKRVKAQNAAEKMVPTVPAVTHEVGQYNVYPDYDEIPKYTGVVEARNFEIFRERLEQAGMGGQAADFFRCSGKLSRDCYKMEIEAAMRSPHVAGFQLLDLQDFPGQGTALVGMLNALRENKGFIEPKDWRGFCGDLVPLAVFDSFVWESGQTVTVGIVLRNNRPLLPAQSMQVTFVCGDFTVTQKIAVPELTPQFVRLTELTLHIPADCIGNAKLTLSLPQEQLQNAWEITVLPPVSPVREDVTVAYSFTEAEPYLRQGGRVLLLPAQITEKIEGFYCADFWNYHMFRIISESMGKTPPVGTMGLCMDAAHPIARAMFSADYSTPQWYEAVTHADCAVLDAAPAGYRPAVQMIDNVERNHRLGVIFEAAVCGGSLLVCTVRFDEKPDDISMNRLHHAVTDYVQSEQFQPDTVLSAELLRTLFK